MEEYGNWKKQMNWTLILIFSSAPLAFFSNEISKVLDHTSPVLGILVWSSLILWNGFVFVMCVREFWKEWKKG
jgi:hypothetical protein